MPRHPMLDPPWDHVVNLLDSGKLFQAREILISRHKPDDPGFKPAGAALRKLWGLDYIVELELVNKLKEVTDPVDLNPLGLGALRWILKRRHRDLRSYIKPGVRSVGVSHKITWEPVAQEQVLIKGLKLYQEGNTHEAQACILNVVNSTSAEIQRLDALAQYQGPLVPGTLELYVRTAQPADRVKSLPWRSRFYSDKPQEGRTLDRSLNAFYTRLVEEGLDVLEELPDKPPSGGSRDREILIPMPGGHLRLPIKDTSLEEREDKSAPVGSQMVRRIPHLDLSPGPPVKPGQSFNVQVYANTEAPRPEEKAKAIEVNFPPGIQRIDLMAHLLVSGHFKISGVEKLPLSLEANQDSTIKISFELRVRSKAELKRRFVEPTELTRGNIAATFSHNGRPAGCVSRDIPVDLDGVRPHLSRDKGEPGTIELDPWATSADLVVEVKEKSSRNQKDFSCKLSTSCLKRSKLVDKWFDWVLPEVTSTLVKRYMQGFTRPGLTPQARLAQLTGAGKDLFDVAPQEFKTLFWQLVDSDHLPQTIAVVSEEPFIPWELMVPNRVKSSGPDSRKPLGVEFTIGRWLPRDNTSAAQRFALAESIVVAPRYEEEIKRLEHADKEAKFVQECIPGLRIDPALLKNITDALEQRKPDLLHFVGHGSDDGEGIQTFDLECQEQLNAVMLRGLPEIELSLRRLPTLVLLNACEVGRATPALCGAGGFAQSMIVLGVGGVIAALWSVKDKIAHQIAIDFYREMQANPSRPFAEILRDIRKRAYSGEAEDTYAAYCFYGDPQARRIRPTGTAAPEK